MRRLMSFVAAAAMAVSVASCGEESSSEPQEARADQTVSVPDTTGEPALSARRRIRAAGPSLAVQYAEEPDSAGGCTVADQDVTGRVAATETVTLTLSCEVEVPNVLGEPAEDAQASIEASGELTATFKNEPGDLTDCTTAGQKPEGGEKVEADAEVALTLKCEAEAPDPLDEEAPADEPDSAEEDPADESEIGGSDQGDNCEPGYDPCLNADSSDYDCEGGTGDGPDYTGPVSVSGDDRFDLDRDGDGSGCDE